MLAGRALVTTTLNSGPSVPSNLTYFALTDWETGDYRRLYTSYKFNTEPGLAAMLF